MEGQENGCLEALECSLKLASHPGPNADVLLYNSNTWKVLNQLMVNVKCSAEIKELALQLAMAMVQHSTKSASKTLAGKRILHSVLEILASEIQPVTTRSAAADLVNVLIAQCKPNCIIITKAMSWATMVHLLERCSDIILQAVLFEIMYRVSRNTDQGNELAAAFPQPEGTDVFTAPLHSSSEFFAITRTFLSKFNSSLGEHQRIFSMQCSDTNQWIDFGVVDLLIQPTDPESSPQLVSYQSIRTLRLSDGQLTFWMTDESQMSFSFSAQDAATLNDRVCGQIRAVAAGIGRVKTSIAILPLSTAPAGPRVIPPSPSSAPHSEPLAPEVVQLQPSPPPSPPRQSPAKLFQAPTQHAQPAPTPLLQEAVAATPAASFYSPLRTQLSSSQALRGGEPITPSRLNFSAGASPLVASFLQFGAALEDQMAQERSKWQSRSEALVSEMQHGVEKLVKHQSREASKRAASDDKVVQAAKDELLRAKRSCTDALAQVQRKTIVVVSSHNSVASTGQQGARDHRQPGRESRGSSDRRPAKGRARRALSLLHDQDQRGVKE